MGKWSNRRRSSPLTAGLAMFAMFFGAGNLIFPLQVGQFANDNNHLAILGLLLTAVIMPIIGLMAVVLFRCNYVDFFTRMGKVPGFSLLILALVILGPFVVIPRCITLAYSIFEYSFTAVNSLWLFALIACILTYVLASYRTRVVDIFGRVLTPLLLGLLLFIIVKGILTGEAPNASELSNTDAFLHGFREGYNTLDLLAALFFSTLVYSRISQQAPKGYATDARYLIHTTLKASFIGGGLLALIYIGMSFSMVYHNQHEAVSMAEPDQLIAAISFAVLGEHAGIVTAVVAALACLTTAISLAIIFAEFLSKTVTQERLGFQPCLLITIIISFCISLFGFSSIVSTVAPLVFIAYPTYIALSAFNIAYKLYGVKWIKTPVLAALLLSLTLT